MDDRGFRAVTPLGEERERPCGARRSHDRTETVAGAAADGSVELPELRALIPDGERVTVQAWDRVETHPRPSR